MQVHSYDKRCNCYTNQESHHNRYNLVHSQSLAELAERMVAVSKVPNTKVLYRDQDHLHHHNKTEKKNKDYNK